MMANWCSTSFKTHSTLNATCPHTWNVASRPTALEHNRIPNCCLSHSSLLQARLGAALAVGSSQRSHRVPSCCHTKHHKHTLAYSTYSTPTAHATLTRQLHRLLLQHGLQLVIQVLLVHNHLQATTHQKSPSKTTTSPTPHTHTHSPGTCTGRTKHRS